MRKAIAILWFFFAFIFLFDSGEGNIQAFWAALIIGNIWAASSHD